MGTGQKAVTQGGDAGKASRFPPAPSYLAEDFLSVRLQLGAQLHARQVSLQQEVGLDVGIVEFGVGQLVGNFLSQLWGEMINSSAL